LREYHRESKFKEIFEFYKINWRQIDEKSLINCAKFIKETQDKIHEL